MEMGRQPLIQPFPPGMVSAMPAEEPVTQVRPYASAPDSIAKRRQQVLDELARLKTHSHRRAELLGRLRELTLAELREGLR